MHFKKKKNESQVLVSLVHSLYTEECYSGKILEKEAMMLPFGKTKPDLVFIPNGNLLAHETWIASIKLLIDKQQKTMITEPLEQGVEAIGMNLPALGGKLSLSATPNPFRQPIFQFKKDTNLPGWSNGFICGF
jgi:hypothetical protein